jgi:hypothetical protein
VGEKEKHLRFWHQTNELNKQVHQKNALQDGKTWSLSVRKGRALVVDAVSFGTFISLPFQAT